MFLKEFEGSSLFVKYGIPVPAGILLEREIFDDEMKLREDVSGFAEGKYKGFAVKAQVLKGGRGKSGLILFAEKKDLLDKVMELKKHLDEGVGGADKDTEILVQERFSVEREFYLAVVVDRHKKCPKVVFSSRGGVDIEKTAGDDPKAVLEVDIETEDEAEISNLLGILFADAGHNSPEPGAFPSVAKKLVELFVNEDAVLAEINPLVLTDDGEIIALDAKVILDDSALERHPDFADQRGRELSVTEAGALEHGLSYVELEGDIAIVGNGAGLVMATLDSLAQKGGKPANFCDIGGGATSEMMKIALKTVMSKKNINGLFINIFGGITRCDEIARGIVEYVGEAGVSVPMVVRITGTNEDEAKEILRNAQFNAGGSGNDGARAIEAFTFFDEAVAAAAKLSK